MFDPEPEPDSGAEAEVARVPAGGPRRTLIVEADGGSRGNPGIAGYGALVRDPDTGRILAEKAEYVGRVSNNVAEYSGLIAALELAHSIDPDCWILAKMDSKLVVEQMSGRWKIKHADMQKLAAKARSIVNPQRVKYQWIPRELNKDADRLSNEAMDAGTAGIPWKPRAGADTKAAAAAAVLEAAASPAPAPAPTGRLHHTEIWVNDFAAAEKSLGWLLERLGYVRKETWSTGGSWQGAEGYIVLESGPDVERGPYSRKRAGLNHLAFRAGSEADVELLARRASSHGWTLLFADRHPHAGGAEHYAAYLENDEGFEVELVAG
ncbi:reverse transcriptase-like protein [Arthrobacter sp. zg-Y877]|uniref:reverse transcriptase-like protein n=1 Tax=Arthrobacter sp. zg-Y877 TaxID=3049074 RepID=UPI001E3ECC15|nr:MULTISPECIES: reverse transcriptase-like protein [unclassified Arthrobacter]MDM7989553.1 reverse transcriptase-like protein [Arthrobacter sp. zg-Y877]